MRPAPTKRLCHLCGTRSSLKPLAPGDYVVDPACPRCLMPYLPTHTVEAAQIETILLSMYAIPTIIDSCGPAIQILTHIAPTCDDVERIRSDLHAIDVPELASRTRIAEHDKLNGLLIFDLDVEVDARLRSMVGDAETGLLQWRINQLCRTAHAASEARANHHRRILEEKP